MSRPNIKSVKVCCRSRWLRQSAETIANRTPATLAWDPILVGADAILHMDVHVGADSGGRQGRPRDSSR